MAAVLACAVALGGCATWLQRPFAGLGPRPHAAGVHPRGPTPPFGAPVPCRGGRFPSRRASRPRDALTIGAAIFAGLARRRAPERFASGAPALRVPVIVAPNTRIIIEVAPEDRDVAGLDTGPHPATTPSTAHRALVCVAGPAQRVFDVAFAVAGARCLPIAVSGPGRNGLRTVTRRVRFGVRRCPP